MIGASSTTTRTQILNRIHKNKTKNLACCSRIVAKIVRGKGSDFVALPEYLVHLLLVSWRIRSRVQFEAVILTVNDYHFFIFINIVHNYSSFCLRRCNTRLFLLFF